MEGTNVEEFMPIAMKSGQMITDQAQVEELLNDVIKGFTTKQALCWGVFKQNTLIGMCGYFRGFSDRAGELGYILHPEYREKGYMKEAARSILNYGFTEMGLISVSAHTDPANIASKQLLISLGFELKPGNDPNNLEFELEVE